MAIINNADNPFWQKSYESHLEHEKTSYFDKLETWKQFDTIDAWRHKRMYDCLLPVIKTYPDSKWLTVGDGRYGTDANYLIRNNINNVLATSISDELLKRSKEDGFISDYKIENAERLSFENNSFDFVLCKESYHHFPRPMIALYEMLRVAQTGVIIIEPNDEIIKTINESISLVKSKDRLQLIKDFIRDFLRIKRYEYNSYPKPIYETVGNYVYSASEREFEKVALGLNYPVIAFKGLNDYYLEGVEFEKAEETSGLFNKLKNAISEMDNNCIVENKNYNILVSVIFKVIPNENTLIELEKAGFKVKKLERNPYMS